MANSLEQLEALRDKLQRARYSGVRSIRTDTEELSYTSDAEMRTALADLDRRIADMIGAPKVTTVRLTTSKGL